MADHGRKNMVLNRPKGASSCFNFDPWRMAAVQQATPDHLQER
jgi:hypothetical protein